jgi:hypothetical protein
VQTSCPPPLPGTTTMPCVVAAANAHTLGGPLPTRKNRPSQQRATPNSWGVKTRRTVLFYHWQAAVGGEPA